MNYRLIWILYFILSLYFIWESAYLFSDYGYDYNFWDAHFISQIIKNLITTALLGIVLGSILAFIPQSNRKYVLKLKLTIPLSLCLLTLVMIIGEYFILSEVKATTELYNYEEISIPDSLDCSSIKNGLFASENLLIERVGDRQTQTDKRTGEVKIYQVNWVNDCEYHLIPGEQKEGNIWIRVKITDITPEYYTCYVGRKKTAKKCNIEIRPN